MPSPAARRGRALPHAPYDNGCYEAHEPAFHNTLLSDGASQGQGPEEVGGPAAGCRPNGAGGAPNTLISWRSRGVADRRSRQTPKRPGGDATRKPQGHEEREAQRRGAAPEGRTTHRVARETATEPPGRHQGREEGHAAAERHWKQAAARPVTRKPGGRPDTTLLVVPLRLGSSYAEVVHPPGSRHAQVALLLRPGGSSSRIVLRPGNSSSVLFHATVGRLAVGHDVPT